MEHAVVVVGRARESREGERPFFFHNNLNLAVGSVEQPQYSISP